MHPTRHPFQFHAPAPDAVAPNDIRLYQYPAMRLTHINRKNAPGSEAPPGPLKLRLELREKNRRFGRKIPDTLSLQKVQKSRKNPSSYGSEWQKFPERSVNVLKCLIRKIPFSTLPQAASRCLTGLRTYIYLLLIVRHFLRLDLHLSCLLLTFPEFTYCQSHLGDWC